MIENKEYLAGYSTFKYPIKGPKGRPLTTTDDIAVKILVDDDDDYSGYVSLTEILTDLIQTVKGSAQGEDVTAEIDSLQEVYNFLIDYKNTETLKEISADVEEVSEKEVDDLFPEFNEITSDKEEDFTNTEDKTEANN